MSARPRITPKALAELVQAAPARVAKKLDQAPKVADGWTWSAGEGATTVVTDGGETVRVAVSAGVVEGASQLSCSCLLSPRCFHILAVAHVLELAEVADDAAAAREEGEAKPGAVAPGSKAQDPAIAHDKAPLTAVTDSQRAAAEIAWGAAVRLLDAGANAAGTVIQGELLRAVHEARAIGLYRLASAGLRVVRRLRLLREASATFTAADLQDDLLDLLVTAYSLRGRPAVDTHVIGIARRTYSPAGNLQLSGILCEPIVSAAGYGGVVTYLVANDGRIFSLSDVLPGGIAHARGAYEAGAEIGDASLQHRELCRAGLFVQDATASEDGRLGAGKSVKAVRASGKGWNHPALASRFAEPYEAQLARVSLHMDAPPETRLAGASLVFLRVEVLALSAKGLLVHPVTTGPAEGPSGRELVLATAFVTPDLACVENLKRLAVRGLRMRVIARVPERGSALSLLAVGPEEGIPPTLALPEAWASLCNVAFDRLQGASVMAGGSAPVVPSTTAENPLDRLSRWLTRLLLGGRTAVPQAAQVALRRDASALAKSLMPEACARLGAIAQALCERRADTAVAQAWMVGAFYERAGRRGI